MFEVASADSGPKAAAKIFTSHQFARALHQNAQNLRRLPGSLTLYPCLRSSADAESNSKGPKATLGARNGWGNIKSPGEAMVRPMVARVTQPETYFYFNN